MKPGKARFIIQINKVEKLLKQAQTHENPALWLFLHDLRTPIFMLEGLSKLYSAFHNKKEFAKLKEKFKALEDALGVVDYYASFQKEFAHDHKLPASIHLYFQQKTNANLLVMSKLLAKGNWLSGKFLGSLTKQLDNLNWKEEREEKDFFKKYYKKQVEKIEDFIKEEKLPFTNIEEHVHELRRKIRWLSIYPQALNGAVKLVETKPKLPRLQKYLIPEIVNSPFNNLQVLKKQTEFLEIDKEKFLALSYMIFQLGELKDKGLKINALKSAYQAVFLLKDEAAYAETYKHLGQKYPQLSQILNDASEISKTYFSEKNLNFLL